MPVPPLAGDEEQAIPDPRRSDVDEWGRSEHMRELARRLYDPIYEQVVPGRVGGPREDPDRRRRAARGQPRRRHPVRRAGDHARHRDRARAGRSTAWPTTSSRALPVVGTLWSRIGGVVAHPDNAYRLLREQQPARARVPRGHARARARPTTSATSCAASAGAASSRSPCGPACRSCPIAVVGAEESMPILFKVPGAGQGARPARTPRSPPTCCAFGPLGAVGLLPGQVQAPGARPGHLRRAARPGPLLAQPDHGRVRGHPGADPGGALRHAAQRRSVWFG